MVIKIIANFPDVLNRKADMRFTYLADLLYQRGHDVELIISDFDHEMKAVRKRDDFSLYDFKITMLHEPEYGNNLSIKRLYAHYIWGKNVEKYLSSLNDVPSVLYVAIPSLTAARQAARYCKNNPSCKLIIDIQDLWPEAFQIVINNRILKNIFLPIKWYVDYAYRAADMIVAVSDTYRDRGLSVNKKVKSGLTVYLGNDGQLFEESRKVYKEDKPNGELWIAYIGTMGYSYDLKSVIKALKITQDDDKLKQKVKFIAMGRGPLLDEFKNYAESLGVNCDFTGALPYPQMVGLMCSCDIVVNCIIKGAAQSITNKVGDYALSGLPVVSTQECEEYRNLVKEYNCGINCECENSIDIASAIVRLANDERERCIMGANAYRLGQERFDRRFTYMNIIKSIESIR